MSDDISEYAYMSGAQCAEDHVNDQALGLCPMWASRDDAWLWWKSIHTDEQEYAPLRRAFEAGWESYMSDLHTDDTNAKEKV